MCALESVTTQTMNVCLEQVFYKHVRCLVTECEGCTVPEELRKSKLAQTKKKPQKSRIFYNCIESPISTCVNGEAWKQSNLAVVEVTVVWRH